MGNNGTVWLPEGASTIAADIDWLFYFVYWTSALIMLLVVGGMVYLAYTYRRRDAGDAPRPVKESKLLEISWVVIPTILVLLVFTWGFQSYLKMNVAPPNAYEIQATAFSWGWSFDYPNGATAGNELHVPVDRPVKINMSSEDVLHSFFIPAFRVKQDVLPDRYSSVWFEANQEGEYHLFCSEYCGTQHSEMIATVHVKSQSDFNAWLDEATAGEDLPLPELGERLYTQQSCNQCHSLDGSRKVGPSFQGLYDNERPLASGETVVADDNYLRESIIEPNAKIAEGYPAAMPSYARLSEREVNALVAFIKEQ
ncbi:MAG: cytochrome c oxidase subunit II [Bacteroidetes bacterium]|jgi:cytochrome c oxidase subunit 2|nr:cytochrome c oxidase subunit II [Bacteroidota bacterium]